MSFLDKLKTKKNIEDKKPVSKPAPAQDQNGEEATVAELKAAKAKAAVEAGKSVTKSAQTASGDTGMAYKWLLQPLITEKATLLGTENKYVFIVADGANKIEIKKALKKLYGVDAIKINIVNRPGKKVRYGKVTGRTKKVKKAIVTLAKGQSIELYEGV
ncbi:MAG: 50S ribosomal protein L23 [Candidatus Komeilibacteria bacterium]